MAGGHDARRRSAVLDPPLQRGSEAPAGVAVAERELPELRRAGPAGAVAHARGHKAPHAAPGRRGPHRGQRFVMIRESVATQVVYVENWFSELLARARQ